MQLRPMLRFTIRDLFWLTLVVAALLGWWVDRGRVVRRAERAEHEVRLWEMEPADEPAPARYAPQVTEPGYRPGP